MAGGPAGNCCNILFGALFVVPWVIGVLMGMTYAAICSTCAHLVHIGAATFLIAILMFAIGVGYLLRACGGYAVSLRSLSPLFVATFIVFIVSSTVLVEQSKLIGKSSVSPTPVPGRPAYKEYRLDQFPTSLRDRVLSEWNGSLSNCLPDYVFCRALDHDYYSLEQLSIAPLTPLQSGCCLPPQSCSFTFVAPTYWTRNQTSSSLGDDCSRWNNDQLCFNCDSCIAALLAQSNKIVEKIRKLTFGVNIVCGLYFLYYILFGLYVRHYPDPNDIQP